MRLWLVAVALCTSVEAQAYPHYQLTREAARCSSCHYSPAGGGLLNAFGRYHSGESLSDVNWPWWSEPPSDADRQLLHGALTPPDWLDFGGGFRLALLTNSSGSASGREWRVVPMQSDLYARAQAGSFSVDATLGLRGFARAEKNPISSYFVSREHYAMWRAGETGPYARAGRFMPVYGLRLADHTAFVRRYLGLGLLDEGYGAGAGWVEDGWEAHATGFLYNPYRSAVSDERGGAAHAELRAGPGALGASLLYGSAESGSRAQGGITAKLTAERFSLMGELDVVRRDFAAWRKNELAGYASIVRELGRGLFVAAAYDYYDPDMALRASERHAFGVWASYMPRAHWELFLRGRWQLVGPAEQAQVALLMLHYYL